MSTREQPALSFDLKWADKPDDDTCTGATWGRLSFFVNGTLFWGRRSKHGPTGFDWTWIDLLEHLAEIWAWLELEDGWPRGISPQTPLDYESAVRARLADLPGQRRLKEKQRFHEFRDRHDLARSLQGAVAPSLWVVREGRQMWLASNTWELQMPAEEVLAELEKLGDRISERIGDLDDPRSREARSDWRLRRELDAEQKLTIVTGLAAASLAYLSDGMMLAWFEAEGDVIEPNEIMAAARMAGALAPKHTMRQIVEWIKRIPVQPTPQLDQLTERRRSSKITGHLSTPAEEGYLLASWLREEILALRPDERLDPLQLLKDWGVVVTEMKLGLDVIDAVAAWGPRHGPAVLINLDGRHAQSMHGRRATLAHEVAHLLGDRDNAMPLADVVGGHVSETVERRARAFAAELLIPRTVAGEALGKSPDPAATLTELCRYHGASEELVAWQARNSEITLLDTTLTFLRSKVSAPERF
jgi:Zn-dependent peptidase ImmA (M78 family)